MHYCGYLEARGRHVQIQQLLNYVVALGDYAGGTLEVQQSDGGWIEVPVHGKLVSLEQHRPPRVSLVTYGIRYSIVLATMGHLQAVPEEAWSELKALGFPVKGLQLQGKRLREVCHAVELPFETWTGEKEDEVLEDVNMVCASSTGSSLSSMNIAREEKENGWCLSAIACSVTSTLLSCLKDMGFAHCRQGEQPALVSECYPAVPEEEQLDEVDLDVQETGEYDSDEDEGLPTTEWQPSEKEKKAIALLHRNLAHPLAINWKVMKIEESDKNCGSGSQAPSGTELNAILGVDVVFLAPLGDRKTESSWLNIVDWGTGFQQVDKIDGQLKPQVFASPTRNGRAERAGKTLKEEIGLALAVDPTVTTSLEYENLVNLVHACLAARHRSFHHTGFTPIQTLPGYTPDLPEEIAPSKGLCSLYEGPLQSVRRAVAMRRLAMEAYTRLDARRRLLRTWSAKSRSPYSFHRGRAWHWHACVQCTSGDKENWASAVGMVQE
eukprot:6458172-Amphidinium_carterae.6